MVLNSYKYGYQVQWKCTRQMTTIHANLALYRVRILHGSTWWREDMNFIFEWQNNILRTSAASE